MAQPHAIDLVQVDLTHVAQQISHGPPGAWDIRAEIRACGHVAEPPEISLKAISKSLALHAVSVAHTSDNPPAAQQPGTGRRPGRQRVRARAWTALVPEPRHRRPAGQVAAPAPAAATVGKVTGTDAIVERILAAYDTITVVGASAAPAKAAHYVPAHMQQHGWRIIPVNPHAEEILGEPVYRTLRDVPEQVGLVDVFRPSRQTPDIARQAVAAGATRPVAAAGHRLARRPGPSPRTPVCSTSRTAA